MIFEILIIISAGIINNKNAGIIVGPKDLPKYGRIIGRIMGKTIKFVYQTKEIL
jgi:hypothetical protein